jgi:hypothetical protein
MAHGTADLGACEFPTSASALSYACAQQDGPPNGGSADYAEADGDGLNHWEEWRYGADPTNRWSALALFPPATDSSGVILSWRSLTNHTYFLERSTDLGVSPVCEVVATNLPGLPGTTSFLDTHATSLGTGFSRVGIQR